MKKSLVFLVLFVVLCNSLFAKQDFSSDQLNFFETKVRPLLAEQCLECHSNVKGKVKGGLSMDTRKEVLRGGESGVIYKAEDVKESPLIKAVNWDGDLHMPEKKKLSKEQIDVFTKWLEQGVPDPREEDKTVKTKTSHWAFQPVVKPKVPFVKNEGWCYNTIDRFVLSKLEEKNIIPAIPALKETLLRRVYFDLIGIPPTPRQIADFIADNNSNAFEKIVDRLLADPGYGERWGRHWLDTARYSDTTGALGNIRLDDYRYAYAWSYRDWVINAINNDMPYNQFLKNQIAADKIINNDKANLAALGFLTVGQRFNNNDEIINDRIDVIGRGMLGLTMACSRCHDHKFDPISMADYYALRGILLSCTEPKEGPIIAGDPNSPRYMEFVKQIEELEKKSFNGYYSLVRTLSDKVRKNAEVMANYMLVTEGKTGTLTQEKRKEASDLAAKYKLNERDITDEFGRLFRPNHKILGPFVKLTTNKDTKEDFINTLTKKDKSSSLVIEFLKSKETLPNEKEAIAKLIGDFFASIEPSVAANFNAITNPQTDPTTINKELLEATTFPLPLVLASEISVDRIKQEGLGFPMRLQNELANKVFFSKINELKLTFTGGPVRAMVLEDKPKPTNSPLYIRGNPPKAGEKTNIVPRRFIEILSPNQEAAPFSETDSGRLELANAIASEENPLTARVLVNRTWMYHFGEGLVKTPDDLGNQAGDPTHPELLDFLTEWFTTDYGPKKPAWSVKALHKAIVMSKTYQQSSNTYSKVQLAEYSSMDPANNLLWRANVRRLDFEAYRDSLLSMGKVLQRDTIGGPSFNVTEEPFIFRRTVYAYIDRANLPDILLQFDMSNPDQPNTKRTSTIVPQQALFLMNSPLVANIVQQISHRPEMIEAITNERNTEKGITTAFKIVLQRTPTYEEKRAAIDFLLAEAKYHSQVKETIAPVAQQAQKLAETKYKQSLNNNNARKAIVNQGMVTERTAFTPWEALIQALIFTNEAAYIN
jgi:hypothetical protein